MALRKYTYFTTDITELGVLINHTYLCFYSSCDFNTKMESHNVIKMTFAGKKISISRFINVRFRGLTWLLLFFF